VIKKGAAPLLIYHGDKDPTINVAFAYALKAQMDKTGNTQSVLHIMEGVGHAAYKLIASEKIPEIVAFLNATMK
jgi:pimeloyl-ACP methyl ester carboxylesterase